MKTFETIKSWQAENSSIKGTLGFVPTMGALHDGHLELVKQSQKENAQTVVSIFVNPTQFNDPKDFQNYPNTLEKDLSKLAAIGVDYVLLPTEKEIYPDRYKYKVQENEVSQILCGKHRPGHFDGVLTIVMRLFNIAQADRAYFGEKDFQQLQLVKTMAESFFMKTQVIPCPTVREADGLAMSSRNLRLKPEHREKAPLLAALLKSKLSLQEITDELKRNSFEVDYIEEHWGRRFGAVKLGDVRLIDNVKI